MNNKRQKRKNQKKKKKIRRNSFRGNVVFLMQPWLVWHAEAFWLLLHKTQVWKCLMKDQLLTFCSLKHSTIVPGQSQIPERKNVSCIRRLEIPKLHSTGVFQLMAFPCSVMDWCGRWNSFFPQNNGSSSLPRFFKSFSKGVKKKWSERDPFVSL